MRGPRLGLILSLLTLTVCNDITETTSMKNCYFVIRYPISKIIKHAQFHFFIKRIYSLRRRFVLQITCICHCSNINFRHLHFFELLLLVSGKSFRYHFDDLLQDNYNSTEFIFDDTNWRTYYNAKFMLKWKLNLSVSGISGYWRVRSGDISPKIFPGFTNGFKMTETPKFILQIHFVNKPMIHRLWFYTHLKT